MKSAPVRRYGRWILFSIGLFLTAGGVAAQENPFSIEVPLTLRLGDGGFSHALEVAARLESGTFGAVLGLAQYSNDRYDPVRSWGFLSWTWYEFLETGLYGTVGPFSFRAGRFGLAPMHESPYTLFRNPVAPAAPMADVVLNAGAFTYRTQWVQLTYNSEFGYRDRGAVIKSYELDLGEWRFGLQDAGVFDDAVFDFEYFVSPLPSYVVQYVNTSSNLPTAQSGDDNSLMGGFVEWRGERVSVFGEFLIDDINLNRFFFPDDRQIPDKLALSTGATYASEVGDMGLYMALATKHTFQAVGYSTREAQYGYTFVPSATVGPDGQAIPLEDNYLGYRWGENALSVMGTYRGVVGEDEAWEFDLDGSLEWVANGSKSPGNPWHQEVSVPRETEFLSDPVLEHQVKLQAHASRPITEWLSLGVLAEIGHIWNGLEVTEVPPAQWNGDLNREAYLAPVFGNNRWTGGLAVTVTGRVQL